MVSEASDDSGSASDSVSSDDDDGVVRALIMDADGSMMNLSIDPDASITSAVAHLDPALHAMAEQTD